MRFWMHFSAGVLVLVVTGLTAWHTNGAKQPEPPIEGIVLLLREPIDAGATSIQDGSVELAVEAGEGSYFSNSAEASKGISELRMQRAVAEHRA